MSILSSQSIGVSGDFLMRSASVAARSGQSHELVYRTLHPSRLVACLFFGLMRLKMHLSAATRTLESLFLSVEISGLFLNQDEITLVAKGRHASGPHSRKRIENPIPGGRGNLNQPVQKNQRLLAWVPPHFFGPRRQWDAPDVAHLFPTVQLFACA